MKREWDPWHTVTVTGTVIVEADPEFEDDVELRFDVTHPEPHENGCPWHRGAGGPKALPPEVMVRADADDKFAAILEATRIATELRGMVATTPEAPVRLEVTLRKAADR